MHRRRLSAFVCALLLQGGLSFPVSAVNADPGVLRIEFLSAENGDPIRTERYVAVCPPDRKWKDPIEERLATPDAVFEKIILPAGVYRVVCSAAGFGMDFGSALVIHAGQVTATTCALPRLTHLRGVISDRQTGAPVKGARIGPIHFFEADSLLGLSPVGMAHASGNYLAVSDENGSYEIRGPEASTGKLWVFAKGYQPAALEEVLFSATQPPGVLDEVSLERGYGFSLLLDGPPNFPWDHFVLALRRTDRPDPDHGTDFIETLRFRQPTAGKRIVYDGLPQGEYAVWLKPRTGHSHHGPQELALVSAGGEPLSHVDLVVGPHNEQTASPPSRRRDIDVLVPESPQMAGENDSIDLLRWKRGKVHRRAVSLAKVSGGRLFRVAGRCDEVEQIQLLGPDVVSPAVAISKEMCDDPGPVVLPIFRSAELVGTIQVPFGFSKPAFGEFLATLCEDHQTPAEAARLAYPFSISKSGEWSATVPAGCHDMELRTKGFVLLSLGRRRIEKGQIVPLGSLRLDPAASLLARVRSGRDGRPMAHAQIQLLGADEAEAVGGSVFAGIPVNKTYQALTDEGGWASLANLPVGTHRLLVIPADEDHVATITDPFLLEQGEETILADIDVPEPAAIEILVDLTELDLWPNDTSSILAHGTDTCGWLSQVTYTSEVDETGLTRFEKLHPGTWRFALSVGSSNRQRTEIAEAIRDLAAGEWATLVLEPEGLVFEGTVTDRYQPVQGSLRITSIDLGSIVTVTTTSDEAGRFRVLLEDEGIYDVRVRREGNETEVPGVAFVDPEETVEIELPGGGIEGVVVDSDGNPVADASVYALSARDPELSGHAEPISLVAGSNELGRFRLANLVSGIWQVRAKLGEMRSGEVRIHLRDDEVRPGVELTLEEGTVIGGSVTVGPQPVGGAILVVQCTWEAIVSACGGVGRTDGAGRFEVELAAAPDGAEVNVLVQRRDLPLSVFRVSVGRDVVLAVPPVGGNVLLSGDEGLAAGLRSGNLWMLHENGGLVSPLKRGQVSQEGSEVTVTILNLMPGNWRLIAASFTDPYAFERVRAGASTLAVWLIGPNKDTEVSIRGR